MTEKQRSTASPQIDENELPYGNASTTGCYDLLVSIGVAEGVASRTAGEFNPRRIALVVDWAIASRRKTEPIAGLVLKVLRSNQIVPSPRLTFGAKPALSQIEEMIAFPGQDDDGGAR